MIENQKLMSLWDHLGELRMRLLKALIALVVTTLLSFIFAKQLIELLTVPIGGIQKLQSIEVTENIGVFMRVSLLSGFILAFPIILYQLIAFISPGLSAKEKRTIFTAIPFATLLFVTGVSFAYLVMLPAAVPFLINFMGIPTMPRASNYIGFITNLLFWIGLSFEMPLLVYILARLKLVTGPMLARQWRIALVVIAVLAAVITPTPDPVNMGLLMLPLFILYLLSIALAYTAK